MRQTIHFLILAILALPAGRAAAYAPIIGQLPSPIIGNQISSTTIGSRYVYADAFDLISQGVDDQTPSDLLKWSYEIVGTPKYAINGAKTINSAFGEHIHPSADQDLIWAMNTLPGADDVNPDGHPNTVTLRNINLYPYGGTPSTDRSPAAQDWDRNMQPVTFWCSDGNSATSQTVMFYTDNTYTYNQPSGWHRLSGG